MPYVQAKARKEIEPKWEWYVLCREPYPTGRFDRFPYDRDNPVKPWNVFDNVRVYDWTRASCRKYLRGRMSREEFEEELRGHFQNQFRSRVEYEFDVSDRMSREGKAYAVDVYGELLPNLKAIARYVLAEYRNAVRTAKEKDDA